MNNDPYYDNTGYKYVHSGKPTLNKAAAMATVKGLLGEHDLATSYSKMHTLGCELLECLQDTSFNYQILWNLSTKQWLSLMVYCIVTADSFNKCVVNRQRLFDIVESGLTYGRITPKQATMIAKIIINKELPLKDTSKLTIRAVPVECLPLPTSDHIAALAKADNVGIGLDEDSDELYEIHEPYWDNAVEAFSNKYKPTYRN